MSAQGRAPLPPQELPTDTGRMGRMEIRTLSGDQGRRPLAPPADHIVHLAHQGYGTDPSERARSAQDVLARPAERKSTTAAGVHVQLRRGGPAALRQAIVLREVLGKPLAMRDDEHGRA